MKLFKNMNKLFEMKGKNITPVNGENIPSETIEILKKLCQNRKVHNSVKSYPFELWFLAKILILLV